MRICDEVIASPEPAFAIYIIRFAVFCGENLKTFSFNVAALFNNFFADVFGNAYNVAHKSFGLFKNVGVELLNKITVDFAVIIKIKNIGVVDMTVEELR